MKKRTTIAALFFSFFFVSSAFADEPTFPTDDPPSPTASLERRENWCQRYVPWYLVHAPSGGGTAPADYREGQLEFVETNACKVDPVMYSVQTLLSVPREVREEALRER